MSRPKKSNSKTGDEHTVVDTGKIPAASAQADIFDRWLNEKLVFLYDPVLREPIPEHLIKLIEAHRRDGKS